MTEEFPEITRAKILADLDIEIKEGIEKLQRQIPETLKLLDAEIKRLDQQQKRYAGFWGYWRFVWDDIRGKVE